MRIATRLFLYVFTLVVASAAVLGTVSVRDERTHLLEESRSKAWLLARTVTSVLRYFHPVDPTVGMERLVREIVPVDGAAPYLRLYDRYGEPVNVTCPECAELPLPHRSLDPEEVGTGREEQLQAGTARFLSVIVPVSGGGPGDPADGFVEVVLPLDHIGRILSGVTRRFLLFTALVAAVLGGVIFLIARVSLGVPIRRLKRASQQLGRGDLSLRIDPTGVADLDELIGEFNRMARHLEEQHAEREAAHNAKLELERSLRHAEKLASIGQLTSGLAHELGTPLNVIGGRVEHLLAKLPADDPSRPALESVVRQVEHIADILGQLLAFSRKGSEGFAPVDLDGVVRDAFSLCRLRSRRSRDAEVVLETDLAVDRLYGDAGALRQMFVNLMLNSFQAIRGGGTVRVATRPGRDGEVDLVYDDDGPGIPEALRDRVFDPFFTTKDVGEGTGLGLYVVANVVAEHRGTVRVGERPGGGVRFAFSFPATPEAEA